MIFIDWPVFVRKDVATSLRCVIYSVVRSIRRTVLTAVHSLECSGADALDLDVMVWCRFAGSSVLTRTTGASLKM